MRTSSRCLLAVTVLLAAACAPSDTVDDPSTDPPEQTADAPTDQDDDAAAGSTTGAEVTDADGDVEVELRTFSFQPERLEIEVGQTVTFVNGDATRHTVTAGTPDDPTGAFDEELAERGDTVSVTFTEPGEYAFHCDPHPFMEGAVVVTG